MPNVRIRLLLTLTVSGLLIAANGCRMEDWDWGFGESRRTGNRRAGTKARRPVTPIAAGPDDRGVEGARGSDDERARAVQDRVATHYGRGETPSYDSTFYDDSLTAKIDRQSDPDRRARIQEHAVNAYRDSSAIPVSDPGTEGADRAPPADGGNPDASAPGGDPGARSVDENREPVAVAGMGAGRPVMDAGGRGASRDTGPTGAPAGPAGDDRSNATDHSRGNERDSGAGAPGGEATSGVTRANTGAARIAEGTGATRIAEAAGGDPPRQPVLTSVEISAAPEPPPGSDNSGKTATPSPNTVRPITPIDTFSQKITDLKTAIARDPNDIRRQFRLRLLYLADGRDDEALASMDVMDEEVAEILEAHIRALLAARSSVGRDAATWAQTQLNAIESLHASVRARADLQVPRIELCTAIDGFGLYEPIEPAEFVVGRQNKVLLYIEVDNYKSDRTAAGMYRTLLTVRWSLLSKDGQELSSHTDKHIEDLARGRRRDFYLTIGPLPIPRSLSAGEYILKAEIEDEIAGKINSNMTTFRMKLP